MQLRRLRTNLDLIAGGLGLVAVVLLALVSWTGPRGMAIDLEHRGDPPDWKAARVLLDWRTGAARGERIKYVPDPFPFSKDPFQTGTAKDTSNSADEGGWFVLGDRPLGSDQSGRNVWTCVFLGSSTALIPGLVAAVVSVLLGTVLGLVQAFGPEAAIRVARIPNTITGALPKFLVLLVFAFFRDMSELQAYMTFGLIVGLLGVPRVAELLSLRVEYLQKTQFLEACRELGVSTFRVIWKHVLSGAALGLLIGQFFIAAGEALLLEAMMAVVGVQIVEVDRASWTGLLARDFDAVQNLALWSVLPPLAMIVLTILSLYAVGTGLTRVLSTSRLAESS